MSGYIKPEVPCERCGKEKIRGFVQSVEKGFVQTVMSLMVIR